MPSARDPELIYRVFGRRLRGWREQKNIPQQELAIMSGLSRASIANIENGKQRVLLHQLIRFSQSLHIELSELLPSLDELGTIIESEAQQEKQLYLKKLKKLTAR